MSFNAKKSQSFGMFLSRHGAKILAVILIVLTMFATAQIISLKRQGRILKDHGRYDKFYRPSL